MRGRTTLPGLLLLATLACSGDDAPATTGGSTDSGSGSTGSTGSTSGGSAPTGDPTTGGSATSGSTSAGSSGSSGSSSTGTGTGDTGTSGGSTGSSSTTTGGSTGGAGTTGGLMGIPVCAGNEPEDPYWITNMVMMGDDLHVDVEASGGCETHVWSICWSGMFIETAPVQATLTVSHEDNDDPCEAIVSEKLVQDLSAIKEAYQTQYQTNSGNIDIRIKGKNDNVIYAF